MIDLTFVFTAMMPHLCQIFIFLFHAITLHFSCKCLLQDAPMVLIAQPSMGVPGMVVSHSSMQAAGYSPYGHYGQPMYAEQTTHDKAPLVV